MGINSTVVPNSTAAVAGIVGLVSMVALLKYLTSKNGNRRNSLPKLGPPPVFKNTDPDIVVVGGGILGASLAARFGMDGKNVVMIEKDMGTDDTFRGEVLLPGGIIALQKMDMQDILDDLEGTPVKGECYFDVRLGGEPGFIHYPKPGAIAMRHGYLVNGLRKKAMGQESVAAIEGVGRELIKENGRVVGVRYHKKKDDAMQEVRAPLVVVGDGYYSKLSTEYRTTHQPISDDLCIALLMKDYKFKIGKPDYMEFSIGHPDAQLCTYQLNERDTRAVIFVNGETPSNLKEFCEEKVVPHLPEHMKDPVRESISNGPRMVRCKRMAANFDATPGMLILGDALNTRHPITAAGMTVALNDVMYWWEVFNNSIHELTDDEAILKQKLVFRQDRLKYSYVINVFAEIAIRLINDHDPSTVTLQQQFIRDLHAMVKPDYPQEDKDELFNIYGLIETNQEVLQRVLSASVEGTVNEIYKTRPYLTAMWESMKIRRKWKAICSDVMQLEAMT